MIISVPEVVLNGQGSVLCGKGLVVHKEQIDIGWVMDEECLVAGRHKMAGLLIGAVANL